MEIAKGMHVATLRICRDSELLYVFYLVGLSELGISFPDDPVIRSVIPREEMHGINKEEKSKCEALLEDFKDLFALTNEDLGCAKDELHKVDSGDTLPISQRAYRRSPKENQMMVISSVKSYPLVFSLHLNHRGPLLFSLSEIKKIKNLCGY